MVTTTINYAYPPIATSKATLYRHIAPFDRTNVFDIASYIAEDNGAERLIDNDVVEGETYYYMVVNTRATPDAQGNEVLEFSDCYRVVATNSTVVIPTTNAIVLKVVGYQDYNDTHSYKFNGTLYNQSNYDPGLEPLQFMTEHHYYGDNIHRLLIIMSTHFFRNTNGDVMPVGDCKITDLVLQGATNILQAADDSMNPSLITNASGVSFRLNYEGYNGVGVKHQAMDGSDRKLSPAYNGFMLEDVTTSIENAGRRITEITEGVTELRNDSLLGNTFGEELILPSTLRSMVGSATSANSGVTRLITNKGLKIIPDAAFASSPVEFLELSETIELVEFAFRISNFMTIICLNPVPPIFRAGYLLGDGIYRTSFGDTPPFAVYVPDAYVDTYTNDSLWGSFNIKPVSEY